MNRRTLGAAVLAAALATTGVAACGTDPNTTEASGDGPLGKVTLRVGDQTGETRSRLEAAGLLKDVPYTITWSKFAAAINLHEALRADAIDIGSAADSPTVSAIAGGSKIKIVAAWRNGGAGNFLLVPKNSRIRTLADLRGKKISPSTRGSVAHYLTLGLLKKARLKESDVTLSFLNPSDASAAFSNGGIDAWTTWGIYAAQARGQLGGRVLAKGEGINSGLGVLSASRSATGDPKKMRAIADYAQRVSRGYAWARDKPDAFASWYAGFAKQPESVAKLVQPDQAAYERVPLDDRFVAELDRTYRTWVAAGTLRGGIGLKAYVDGSIPVR